MQANHIPVSLRDVTLEDVRAAAVRISRAARRTPLLPLPVTGKVFVKAESLQTTGSFKLRGAYNALAQLSPGQLSRGVVTHSSGNHGQGLACAASMLGCPATIVIPEGAPQVKVDRTLSWGARVVRCGPSAAEREQAAAEQAERYGLTLIPPFDHPDVIAGQGTVGLEILDQLPDVANVLVPVGGGGLLSGIALAISSLRPGVRVFGVEPELAADAAEAFARREPVRWDAGLTTRTVADGVRTQQVGVNNLPLILKHVSGFLTATESGILEAARFYAMEAKLVAEPTGALTLAAWRELDSGDSPLAPGPTVLVLSGGNVDPALLATLAA